MNDVTRLPGEQRRALILSAAVELANEHGLNSVTFEAVAKHSRIKTTARSIRIYYSRATLWDAVISDPRANKMVADDALALGVL